MREDHAAGLHGLARAQLLKAAEEVADHRQGPELAHQLRLGPGQRLQPGEKLLGVIAGNEPDIALRDLRGPSLPSMEHA